MSGPEQLTPVFDALRPLMASHEPDLVVVEDAPGNYYLDTKHVMKNGKPLFFGAVQTRKHYVSYHLMPVYVNPALLEGLGPELRKRMHGKSCFNFTKLDERLLKELAELTQAGYDDYVANGYIVPAGT